AQVHQLLADVGGGLAGLDLDRDVAGARARVVPRVQVGAPEVVEADDGDGEDDHQDGERDPPRGTAHGALALGLSAARPVRPAAAWAGPAGGRGPVGGAPRGGVSARPGRGAAAGLVMPPALAPVRVFVPTPRGA